jgi:hypothetical protein
LPRRENNLPGLIQRKAFGGVGKMTGYCSDLAKDALTSPYGFAEYLRHGKEGEIRRLIHGMSECQELNDLVNQRIKEMCTGASPIDVNTWYVWMEAIDRFRFLERSVKFGGVENEEPPPELPPLKELAEGKYPVLRKWKNGKYKCFSLPVFIEKYLETANILTPSVIRDYLISDRTAKPYSDNTIETELKIHGFDRKSDWYLTGS